MTATRSDREGSLSELVASWAEENLQPVRPVALVLGGLVAYLAILAYAWQHTSYDVWGALFIAPVLVALTAPIARRVARLEDDETMVRLVMGALLFKLFMSLVRYVVAFGVYGGVADAGVYDNAGWQLAKGFRSGNLDTLGLPFSGAGFIKILTGIIYTITGPTQVGGFLVFSWLGFWGLYLMYRAFRVAFPDGMHRRYARILFFLPSMAFWPSSIGKEAWMSFILGITSYGMARLITHQRGGIMLITVGIVGGSFVRPHVMLMALLSIGVAYLLRPGQRGTVLGVLPKLFGIVLLLVAGVVMMDRVQGYFGVSDLDEGGTEQALEIAQSRTDTGGSAYKTVDPTSPGRFAWAVVTVLFRPFPNEANNIQSGLASLESIGIALFCAARATSALRVLRNLRTWSYGAFCLVYILLFSFGFARIGNFGILTRQRVQVLPFLLVLLCLPPARKRPQHPVDGADVTVAVA